MEVSGKKSESDIFCVGSNDGDGDIFCDPCENDGEMQPAEGFCEDCQEYLCSSCFKIHRRPVLWRHHVLLDKDAMPKTKTKEKLNFECIEPCVEHSTKIIEYYCQTHDQLGCPVCITGKHKTCNDVEYIPHIAERYGESSEMEGIFDSLEGLQKKADVYTCKANKEKLKVAEFEKEAKARVLQLRDEFNSICDRLKEEIDSVKRSDERKINDSIMKYEDISRKIKTRAGVLEKKRTEMKISQLFTEAKLSKVSVVDLTKQLDSANENAKIQHYDIDFSVETLRSGLKLNFLDDEVDTDTEIDSLNPSGQQIKVSDEKMSRCTTDSSPQTMTTRPPLHYPVSTINPNPLFRSNPSRLQTGPTQTIMKPYMTPQQRLQRPNFYSGVPLSHQHPQQSIPSQFHPSVIVNKAANDQRSEESQINKKHNTEHILSIFDPIYGANVTKARGNQDSASEMNSAEMSKVEKMLNKLIVRRKMDNEAVMEWIDSNVDATSRKGPQFIRALVTVVFKSAIKGNKGKERLQQEEISSRNDLLQRYLGNDSELELQALYAVQTLITELEHPKGVLRSIFDTLYDEDIISEDAFFKWQMSEEEPDGKKTCLLQTRKFFT